MDCKCSQCFGLAEYMFQVTGKDYGLPRAPGCLITPIVLDPCDGSMTCECARCVSERRSRIMRPIRPAKQPWDADRSVA